MMSSPCEVLSATYVVGGSIGRFGSQYVVNIKVIEVQTATTVAAESKFYDDVSRLLPGAVEITRSLFLTTPSISSEDSEKLHESEPSSTGSPVPESPFTEPNADDSPDTKQTRTFIPELPIVVDGMNGDWRGVQRLIRDAQGDSIDRAGSSDLKAVSWARYRSQVLVLYEFYGTGLRNDRFCSVHLRTADGGLIKLEAGLEGRRWQGRLYVHDAEGEELFYNSGYLVAGTDASVEARFPLGWVLGPEADAEITVAESMVVGLSGRRRYDETAPVSLAPPTGE